MLHSIRFPSVRLRDVENNEALGRVWMFGPAPAAG
jgi:hypothetical protein